MLCTCVLLAAEEIRGLLYTFVFRCAAGKGNLCCLATTEAIALEGSDTHRDCPIGLLRPANDRWCNNTTAKIHVSQCGTWISADLGENDPIMVCLTEVGRPLVVQAGLEKKFVIFPGTL